MFLHLPRAKTTREKNESPICFVSNSKLVSPYFLLLLQLYYTLADTIMSPPFFSRCSSSSQGGGGSMHFPGCPYIEYIQNNNILWGFSCPTTHLPRPFLIFFHFLKKYTFTITMVTIRCFMCQGVLIPRPVSLPYEPRMFYDIRVNFAQHAHDSLVSTFA